MSKDKEYPIGYKKPPVKNQFQKGKSGNAKGRPKGVKGKANDDSLLAIIQKELSRSVTVHHGEEKTTLTMAAATFRSLSQKAAKGDIRAMRLFFEMAAKAEEKKVQAEAQLPQRIIVSWKRNPGEEGEDKD